MSYSGAEALTRVLQTHLVRYPKMEIADFVKLAFQSEFAGGHMIPDKERCLSFLTEEWEAISPDPRGILWEDIGGGLMRLYLPPAKAKGLRVKDICDAFIKTANEKRGTADGFSEKLLVLLRLTEEKAVPIPWEPLNAYLAEYRRRGCPPVHHSPAYRAAYDPHYRVIDPACWKAD